MDRIKFRFVPERTNPERKKQIKTKYLKERLWTEKNNSVRLECTITGQKERVIIENRKFKT